MGVERGTVCVGRRAGVYIGGKRCKSCLKCVSGGGGAAVLGEEQE